MIFNVM